MTDLRNVLRQIERILLDSKLHLNGRETQILRLVQAALRWTDD